MLDKLNRYSSYSSQIRLENKQSSSILKACLKSGWTFIRCYAFQLGCLEGRLGLLFAVYHAQASFYRAVKQCYPDRKGGAGGLSSTSVAASASVMYGEYTLRRQRHFPLTLGFASASRSVGLALAQQRRSLGLLPRGAPLEASMPLVTLGIMN